jgi:hypothetical protein
MKLKPKIVKYGGVHNPTKKSTITQAQIEWMQMEIQTMRELNESLQNRQRSKTESA